MVKKTIVVHEETHERLRKYKNARSAVMDRDLSFEGAIIELLNEAK